MTKNNLNTKTALITGGTSGVGLSIARALVKNNYTIYFIGTNQAKGKKIETALSNKNTKATFIKLDLSNLKEVKHFLIKFKQEHTKLDLLLNVAGIMSTKQRLTKEGFDKTFAIGYLSVFMFCNKLITLLEKGENARIVNVSGEPFQVLKPNLDFNNLNFKNVNGFKIAFATMHAKTVLTQILAEKLVSKNITVNAFHPGIVKSNLSRNLPIILKILSKIAAIFMAKESVNGIYCCLSTKIKDQTGKLFVKKKPITINFKEAYRLKLWHKTNELLNAEGLL